MPTAVDTHAGWPAPGPEATAQSIRLTKRIRAELDANGGRIPFRRFMELVLYAPGLGYYSGGARKLGPAGDFVTAPELSPLFSRCLARQCAQVLAQTGGDVLELGAGTGVMAADMLGELERLGQLPNGYRILEVSADLRERQKTTLAERAPALLGRAQWLERLPDSGFRGVILGNEVLDAMPVQRFRVTDRGVRPLEVVWKRDRFAVREGAADATLAVAVAALEAELGHAFPVGYESELNPSLTPWLSALAETLEAGLLLLIDYGYPRREYYHPQRARGTLLCHYRHRVHDDPFFLPGLQDITASVDFSAVADAALAAGLTVAGYSSQAYFLFGCGLEALLAESDPEDLVNHLELTRQIKLLTLPGEMGERFKVMALARSLDGPLLGFGMRDQRGLL
jgi:SAM-dependent MidA family methyltransferase